MRLCRFTNPPRSQRRGLLGLGVLAMALTLLCGVSAAQPLATLPAIADAGRVSVSGISSGAAMAVQYAVAHSATVSGVATIAGPGWGCAQGKVSQALNSCMCTRSAPPATVPMARQLASTGAIDALTANKPRRLSRAFVFHSREDATVKSPSGDAGIAFLKDFIGQAPTVDRGDGPNGSERAGHGFVSPDGTDTCRASPQDRSYVRRCGDEDNAADLLRTLYPDVAVDANERPGPVPDAALQAFDQTPFIAAVLRDSPYIAPDALWWYVYPYRSERRMQLDMAASGYLYVPPACRQAGTRCGVHIALHGCKQDVRQFARTAGYNRWADRYRLIVVYPAVQPGQATVSEGCAAGAVPTAADAAWAQPNPNGCWDWWGYLDGLDRTRYLTRSAPQMQVIERIVQALTRGP